MKKKYLAILAVSLGITLPLHGALMTSGEYDEQTAQSNSVNHVMGYSGNTDWTTGIGQTLGSAQVMDFNAFNAFKTEVSNAFSTGRGGVINFDGVDPAAYNNMQSFTASFAGGAKSLTFTNYLEGSYSIAGPSGDRTAISGSQFLATGGNAHFGFDITGTGFAPDERVVSLGVTILGRNGQPTGRNYRVIAYYTNDPDNLKANSSSTFRSFNMENGNGTEDSFSGIVAPEGYWITALRIQSDQGVFTSLDDIAFTTAIIPEPGTYALIFGGLALLLAYRLRRR